MNEKNFEYLGNQLKYSGFGEELQQQLQEKMKQGEPQFTLGFQRDFGNDKTAATLHFKRSTETDLYFFNSYTALLTNKMHPDTISQSFRVSSKEDNVTFKEAYNLLSGRSVFKELTNKAGEEYKAWLQLDFKETDAHGNFKVKQYHQNYNYDLAATLAKHPIKELQVDGDRKQLMDSLERGNRQSVTVVTEGRDQKVYVEAVPQFKSLNFYSLNGQRIRLDKEGLGKTEQQPAARQEQKQQTREAVDGDDAAPPKRNAKKERKPGQRIH